MQRRGRRGYNGGVLITISGLPGSGKTTVARLVAQELGLEHVYAGDLFRRQAEAAGLTLEEYARRAETDHSIDRRLDDAMRARAPRGDAVPEGRPAAPVDVIQRAYEFSASVHKGQRRASGEPYLTHPLQVAGIIADLRLDVPSVATGLLHDTVEDTLATLAQIEQHFGTEIAGLVDGVTKIGQINFPSREEKQP